MTDRFDAQLRQHLLGSAIERPADGQLAAVIDAVAATSQRTPLVARLTWNPGRLGRFPAAAGMRNDRTGGGFSRALASSVRPRARGIVGLVQAVALVAVACGGPGPTAQPSTADLVGVIAERVPLEDRVVFRLEGGREVVAGTQVVHDLWGSGGGPGDLLLSGQDDRGRWVSTVDRAPSAPAPGCFALYSEGTNALDAILVLGARLPKASEFTSSVPEPAVGQRYEGTATSASTARDRPRTTSTEVKPRTREACWVVCETIGISMWLADA